MPLNIGNCMGPPADIMSGSCSRGRRRGEECEGAAVRAWAQHGWWGQWGKPAQPQPKRCGTCCSSCNRSGRSWHSGRSAPAPCPAWAACQAWAARWAAPAAGEASSSSALAGPADSGWHRAGLHDEANAQAEAWMHKQASRRRHQTCGASSSTHRLASETSHQQTISYKITTDVSPSSPHHHRSRCPAPAAAWPPAAPTAGAAAAGDGVVQHEGRRSTCAQGRAGSALRTLHAAACCGCMRAQASPPCLAGSPHPSRCPSAPSAPGP